MADTLGKIRKEVGKGLIKAGLTRVAILIRITRGDRDPVNLSAGPVLSESSLACRGIVVVWKRARLNATEVNVGDRVVKLIGLSLGSVVPKIGDKITIEGCTSRIVDIERDPAGATFDCLTRS